LYYNLVVIPQTGFLVPDKSRDHGDDFFLKAALVGLVVNV
jgi:hypothetical protein